MQKNKLASKFAASIAVATRLGGADPSGNVRLALAIENANKANVSKKIIENAIKRGSGESTQSGSGPSEIALYEAIGPSGVAFVLEALTDNKSRTAGLVKSAFSKNSGMLTPTLFLFNRQGWVKVAPGEEDSFDEVFETAVDCGAEDVEGPDDEGVYKIVVSPQETSKMVNALKDRYKVVDMGIEYAPNSDTLVDVEDDKAAQLEKLMNILDEVTDITQVYTNIRPSN